MAVSLFLMAAGLILALTAVTAVYFLLYKRRINRALRSDAAHAHAMWPPSKILVTSALLLLSVAVVVSYFVGYKTAYDRLEAGTAAPQAETFYGEIIEITGSPETGNAITIQGLDINDPRYRGEFSFAVYGETMIEWQGMPLEFSDLEPGDRVSVTFDGEMTASSPTVLPHVLRIQLLDDAK